MPFSFLDPPHPPRLKWDGMSQEVEQRLCPYNEVKQQMWLQQMWLVDPTLFFPRSTPPPRLKWDGKPQEVEQRLCPYNEVKQGVWLVDHALFFPRSTPPPKVEVGWYVAGSRAASVSL